MLLVLYIFGMVAMASTLEIQLPATVNNSLQNKHFKVAAEPFHSFIIFFCNGIKMGATDTCSDRGSMTYGGALWELLKLVQLSQNVTFSILRPQGSPKWGDCYGHNNCTGMIGMVNRREVDFALGKIFICIY